jgi:hypothetical protein
MAGGRTKDLPTTAVAECSGPRRRRRLVDHDSGRGGGMVYADGSNPSVRKDIGVRLPSPALLLSLAWWCRVGTAKRRGSVCGLVDLVTVGFKHLRFCRAGPAPPSALLRLVPERGRRRPLFFRPTQDGPLGSFVITSSQTSWILAGNGQSVITSAETTTLGA